MSSTDGKTLLNRHLDEALRGDRSIREIEQRMKARSCPFTVRGPKSGFLGYVIHRIARDHGALIVLPNESDLGNLQMDLHLFGIDSTIFPSFGTQAYSAPSDSSPVWGDRMRALTSLKRGGVVLAPIRALVQPIASTHLSPGGTITIRTGDTIDPTGIARRLHDAGYWRVPRVSVHGEYAVRGEVIDLFLPGWTDACRIVLDYDEVVEIRAFDPLTQSSVDIHDLVEIYPIREVSWTIDERRLALENALQWEELSVRAERCTAHLMDDEHEVIEPEWIAALGGSTITDYIAPETPIVWIDQRRLDAHAESIRAEYDSVYLRDYAERILPKPERVVRTYAEVSDGTRGRSIFVETLADGSDRDAIRFSCDPPRSFFGNVSFLKEELATLLGAGNRVMILADTDVQQKRIATLLGDYDVEVVPARISGGFALPDVGVVIIQENEIFGRRKRAPASVKRAESRAIDTFVELEEGDYVVHLSHGIGLYRGIQRLRAGGNERDYIRVEYADEEMVFVPIEQVNLIQRYIGTGGGSPRIDRIGGKSWDKRKSAVRKNVEDLADRLIALYSRRKTATGFAFPPDTEWQLEFESAFPYDETADQLTCIAEIKADMERPEPMDRLVCGDVGYGKTELALRAAFKAVTGGKQVALLAPTTILVEQHVETIEQRFEQYPVSIAMLSRFVSKSEQKRTIEQLAAGEIDLVVGTHRLLQKDVRFKNLGLLVIDEEQRFGVKAKERLKELKTNVDCLTLTATPIPRTLHMSLLKIRDMSLLTTPPHNRRPIQTTIGEFNDETIARAIRDEIDRGGQVFYLHNRVETLENIKRFIETIVPEALVEVAHGQMSSSELEEIMHRFVHEGFHVLAATTIIENGIDIPNVNTIIIDRADMYGISQLYQLKGRVGRSDRTAYAYLFYPEDRALSEIAMKRLQIVSDFTELGSGFKIALKDLEVRGAGNILGSRQSGDILSVGFDLYLRLLDEAIREREEQASDEAEEVYLELEYSGYIPDSYISEPMEKMEVYKKIASVSDQTELDHLVGEIEDRFGPMPDEVQSLLSLAEIRVLSRRLHVTSMKERRGVLEVEFGRVAIVSAERVLALIKNAGGSVRLDPNRANVLILDTEQVGLREKSEYIVGRLSQLL
jgi:transcription-repair coupling factor (superfamily II helicase)